MTETQEVLNSLPSKPVRAEAGGDHWDYYLILEDGSRVGYNGSHVTISEMLD